MCPQILRGSCYNADSDSVRLGRTWDVAGQRPYSELHSSRSCWWPWLTPQAPWETQTRRMTPWSWRMNSPGVVGTQKYSAQNFLTIFSSTRQLYQRSRGCCVRNGLRGHPSSLTHSLEKYGNGAKMAKDLPSSQVIQAKSKLAPS